jgi:vitamin B12 transporter
MSFRSATLLAIAGFPSLIAAEAVALPTATPEEIIVTADRRPTSLDRTTAAVSVVTDQDDAERGRSLEAQDRLSQIPGLTVIKGNGGLDGGTGSVIIRGNPSKYTQFLVDGLPISEASTPQGDRNPTQIDPSGLNRVEVVKGSQSGLYGSRAIGGVVNYLTDRPTADHRTTVRGQAGSYGIVDGDVRATGPLGDQSGYAASVQAATASGFSTTTTPGATVTRDGNGDGNEADGYDKGAARLRLETRPVTGLMLYTGLSGNAANGDYDSPSNAFPYPFAPEDQESYTQDRSGTVSAGGTFGDQHAPVEAAVDAAYLDSKRFYRQPGYDDATYRSDEWYGQGRVTGRPMSELALTAGADVKRQHAEYTGFNRANSNLGLWGQAAWSITHAELSLTGRSDIPSTEQNSHTTGRAGLALFPITAIRLRAAGGTGFRSPSLYEYYGDGVYTLGNPALKPETTRQGEVGLDLMPISGTTLSATAFRTLYDRRIDYVFDLNTFLGSYANDEANSRSDGIESSLEVDEPADLPLTTRLWYTLTRTADANGQEFLFTPRHSGGASTTVRQNFNRWSVFETASLERQTGYRATTGRASERSLFNVAVGTTYDGTYEAALRAENLLNDTSSPNPTASGNYTTAGLTYVATLGAQF